MYTLDIFKENNIDYSWATVYVGKKLGFLKLDQISEYAVEYLTQNPDCTDSNIAGLAYGVSENEIDEVLTKVFKNIGLNIEKDSPIWNLEKRKWRYCILKYFLTAIKDQNYLLTKIDEIYSDFGYPVDMVEFIHYPPEAGFNKLMGASKDQIDTHIKELLTAFESYLQEEKHRIQENVISWPDSIIYYPVDKDEFKRD